jgi:hypothetical protein
MPASEKAADPAPVVEPVVTMPANVAAKVGRYARVVIAYTGDDMKWWTDGLDGLDVFQEWDPKPSEMILRIGGDAGVYQLHAVCAAVVGGKAVLSTVGTTTITLGTPPPKPPVPPTPPTPPGPTDPLTAALQAAYDADKDADKASSLAFLALTFKGMASLVPTHTEWKTNADAMAWMKATTELVGVGLTPAQVLNLRKAIGADLAAQLGAAAFPVNLKATAAAFDKVAAALQGVH